MIDTTELQERLCRSFCESVRIRPVPCGYAVSSFFSDNSGDPIQFFIIEDGDTYYLEDSGDFLATLKASDVDFETGTRASLLAQVLEDGNAFWDEDSFEIRSKTMDLSSLTEGMLLFTSALMRARDVGLLTRDVIRSTFREDATRILEERYRDQFSANDNVAIDQDFQEFRTDLVLRPIEGTSTAAVYFVNNNEKLLEAQLMLEQTMRKKREDVHVIALIETLDKVSQQKFQRAQNRGLEMPIFQGDEYAAIDRIAQSIQLAASHS